MRKLICEKNSRIFAGLLNGMGWKSEKRGILANTEGRVIGAEETAKKKEGKGASRRSLSEISAG